MQSNPFDFLTPLRAVFDAFSVLLPETKAGWGTLIAFILVVRIGAKILIGAPSGGAASAFTAGSGSGSGGAEKEKKAAEEKIAAEKEKAEEARREEEIRQNEEIQRLERERQEKEVQEKLNDLFNLTDEGKEKPEELEKTVEDKELEALGTDRAELSELREEYKSLVCEICSLLEKGLDEKQTAKALVSRTTEQIGIMELKPLIEAMNIFLKKNEESEKDTAVIGLNGDFEQRAAVSALKRGDYDFAVAYFERQAESADTKADSSLRGDVRDDARERAADFYFALGVLTRPVDVEKSFEFLRDADERDPENPQTEALIGRAYYESGNKNMAEKYFDAASDRKTGDRDAVDYAAAELSEIRIAETALFAEAIRRDYEERLGETEDRTRESEQRADMNKQKRAEVDRAVGHFVMNGVRERTAERDEF